MANRFHARKSHGFPLRVNPILVFATNQLSMTSTVAHCKSIGSSRAARSRQQKPNLDFSSRSCLPLSPERGSQFASRINISYVDSLERSQYYGIRADIIQAGARTRIEAENKFCLMHFADLFFSLDLIISPNVQDDYYRKKIYHQFHGFVIKY